MSQIAIAVIPEAAAVVIGTENANPNAESISVLKAKDVEHVVCTENLRSESSTPVKDNVEAQLVATSQPSELAQQQQPENIEAPAAEQTAVVTDAAVEAVVAPAQASASEPESVAKDEAAAGAKRPIESADDISVSKASKDDK